MFSDEEKNFAGYDAVENATESTSGHLSLVRRNTPSLFGSDNHRLDVQFSFLSSYALRVKIFDSGQNRYLMQDPIGHWKWLHKTNFRFEIPKEAVAVTVNNDDEPIQYVVRYRASPFGFKIQRIATQEDIFDTDLLPGQLTV